MKNTNISTYAQRHALAKFKQFFHFSETMFCRHRCPVTVRGGKSLDVPESRLAEVPHTIVIIAVTINTSTSIISVVVINAIIISES